MEATDTPLWVRSAIARFFTVLVGLGVSLWLMQKLRDLLVVLLVALVFSFALEPAVNWFERRGVRRGFGTLLTLIGVVGALALFTFAMGRLLRDQVVLLIDEGPQYIRESQDWINATFDTQVDAAELLDEFSEGGRVGDLARSLADDILGVGATLLSAVLRVLTVLLFTFYLVSDGPRLRRFICSVFSPDRQREILRVWEFGIQKTGGYIYSRALLALLAGAMHWAAFAVIGIPSPLAMAVWVGVLSQFIPVIGIYIAGVLPVLIALVDRPASAIWVLAFLVIYQQIENYVLAPRITAQTMELHAAVAFGSVLAGSAILGPIGALLSLPLAATIQAFGSTYVRRHDVVASALTSPKRPASPAPGPAEID